MTTITSDIPRHAAPEQTDEVETEQLATGCEAIAEAIRLADVDVMAAYPIRPYDGVMQAAAKLIANGKMDVEYIVADGEHSQFAVSYTHLTLPTKRIV